MKYIKKFDSVSDMETALASSTISVLGMAMDGNTPVINIKKVTPTPPGPSPSIPFYVENITQDTETLTFSCCEIMNITIQYSVDATNWETLGTAATEELEDLTMDILPGSKIYLRSNTNTWCNNIDSEDIPWGCTISGVSKVGGNIMSLIYGNTFTGNEVSFPENTALNFGSLFNIYNNTDNYYLIDASELILPATTLTPNCYRGMFGSCKALTTAPATLPATTLAPDCYRDMFRGCDSLITAPALPATTLAENCYYNMFQYCTVLTTAPATLPATTLADWCYHRMFNGCTSLTAAPALPATTLTEGCYYEMFSECNSLTTAPTLPATTLADSCYYEMFYGCESLTTAPATLPATTLATECYNEMFYGCESLTTAPELPAATLADSCYRYMFGGCTNLNYIKCLATDISASGCTTNWVWNVAATGTFVKPASMSNWETGEDGIPSDWTVQDAAD